MHNAHAGGCGAVSRPSRVPKKARRQPGPFLFFFSHVIHNKGDDDRDESDRHDFSFKVAHLHQPPQTTRWQMFEKKKRKKKLRAIGPALDLYASLDVISVRGGDESTRSVPPRRTLCTGIILQVTTPSLSFLCLLLLGCKDKSTLFCSSFRMTSLEICAFVTLGLRPMIRNVFPLFLLHWTRLPFINIRSRPSIGFTDLGLVHPN